jgi:hypothetical protein
LEERQRNVGINNLRQIEAAKNQWASEDKKGGYTAAGHALS